MIQRNKENPIIKPSDISPSRDDFEVIGVFNAAASRVGERTFLLLRVAEKVKSKNRNEVIVSFLNSETKQIEKKIFKKSSSEANFDDPRIVKTKRRIFLTSLSHFRSAWSNDGVHFEIGEHPCLYPGKPFEAYGVEDPRLQWIEEKYILTYSAVSANGIATALATSDDLEQFERKGLVFLPNNRNIVIFPEKIKGNYVALHRPFGHGWGEDMVWIAYSPDLFHWGGFELLMRPCPGAWDCFKIGAGAPPIKTEEGWLLIYHGADEAGKYALGVVLLDFENPTRILGRSKEPVLDPETSYEQTGFFGGVVFTCGAVLRANGQIDIYYGASDEVLCLASTSEKGLLSYVSRC